MPPVSSESVEPLRQPILAILRSSDLSVISAKRVRAAMKQTADPLDPGRTLIDRLGVELEDKEHKKVIDALIRQCFDVINADPPAPSSQAIATSTTAGNGFAYHHNGASKSASSAPTVAAPKIALPGLGGIPGSHVADVKPKLAESSSVAGVKRKPKNDDIISEDEDDIETVKRKAVSAAKKSSSSAGGVKKKRKAATTSDGEKKPPNPNNPFNKPVVLSTEMSTLFGQSEMPRYEITKRLWAYIKERDLQNPANKRQILCDPTLTSLFGKSSVDSFEMAKLISKHVTKKVE